MEQSDIIDTTQLRAFQAVAETGSFSRAASALGTAQSSISQQVGRLEKRAGQLLIRRTTRRVELTPAGVSMLVYVRSILAMADDARRSLSVPPVEGLLRVGIAEEFATTKLSDVLAVFRRQHPQFELQFLTGRNDYLYSALESANVDIILGKRHTGRKKGELLWQETLVWVGRRSAVERHDRPLPLVSYLRPSETRDVAEAALLAVRRTWTVVAQSDSLLGLLAAARAGPGVMALGENFVPSGLEELSQEAGLPRLGTVDYVIDHPKASSDPGVTAFAAVLRGFTRQLMTRRRVEPASLTASLKPTM